jgi:hypothetical protein
MSTEQVGTGGGIFAAHKGLTGGYLDQGALVFGPQKE